MYRELLIGAGSSRDKRLAAHGTPEKWENLTTLDVCERHGCDVLHDLNDLPLPFDPDSFDEIHAYEVLEHTGQQGDWEFFLDQFSEFHRILKPGGLLIGTCPSYKSMWAWGDPSHTRVLTSGSFVFLTQAEYARQVGITAMSDFRSRYKADFEILQAKEDDVTLSFCIKALK